MEQRDYFERQIEQLGKVLSHILGQLMQLNGKGDTTQNIRIENTKNQIEQQLNLDLDELCALDKEATVEYLEIRKIDAQNLVKISDILCSIGVLQQDTNPSESMAYLKKSLEILEYVEVLTNTTSFEILQKIGELKSLTEAKSNTTD